MNYYVLSTDGAHNHFTRKITNPEKLQEALDLKAEYPDWDMSINSKGFIDTNPSAPFYIYGALKVYLIIDENRNMIYSFWSGEHKEAIDRKYLAHARI